MRRARVVRGDAADRRAALLPVLGCALPGGSMSYWVYLTDERGDALPVDSFIDGGTYALGGTTRAELNVTYNYAKIYGPLGFSLRDLDGKTAAETIAQIANIVAQIGTERDSGDYWAPTPGNAGRALSRLLEWAKQHPAGLWSVS
jgi:hypothetical protein